MACCPAITETFVNVPETVVPYGADRQVIYGAKPFVQVVYFVEGELIISNNFSGVSFNSNNITVDHGGNGSGFIIVR